MRSTRLRRASLAILLGLTLSLSAIGSAGAANTADDCPTCNPPPPIECTSQDALQLVNWYRWSLQDLREMPLLQRGSAFVRLNQQARGLFHDFVIICRAS